MRYFTKSPARVGRSKTVFAITGVLFAITTAAAIADSATRWSNDFKTEKVTPQLLVQPTSAKQLTDYISQAASNGQRVRMTGSGHSMSDIAITQDVLMTPERLNKPLTLDSSRLKNPNPVGLMRVESGITIADLNTYLDHQGRALFNMGGYDGQTLAGVMMTATHGSGLAYGPIADQMVSLQMVVDGGAMVQIEPSNGITNPAAWPGTLEEDVSVPVQLIQDDDAFNAARISIGSMGVVYSATLNTDQKFWLREVRHAIKWSELKKPGGHLDRIINGLPVYEGMPSPEHWELFYSPYPDANGDYNFVITDRYRSYTPLPEQSEHERGQPGASFAGGLVALLGKPLGLVLEIFPNLAPIVVDSSMSSQLDTGYTNVSYKVFNIGAALNSTPVFAIETAFRLDQIISAIERSFTANDALYAKGIPQTAPIAIRFVKQSDGLIAMQQGHDTAFMEIIVLQDCKKAMTLLSTHRQIHLQEFQARPHWGLDNNSLTSEAQVRSLYPKTWDRWKTQYLRFNSTGTFDGKVTDRLGISVRPRG